MKMMMMKVPRTDELAIQHAHPVSSLEDAVVGLILELHHDLLRRLEEEGVSHDRIT